MDAKINKYYKYNHDYFKKIDTEHKAYFLGFIIADGCIRKGSGNRQSAIALSIINTDGYIVDKLANDICGGRVGITKHPPSVKKAGHSPQRCVVLTSKSLVNSLETFGIKNNKTKKLDLDFTTIPNNLIHHVVRGFFDGDGGITVDRYKSTCKNEKTGKKTYYYDKVRKRCYFTGPLSNVLDYFMSFLPNEITVYRGYRKPTIKRSMGCWTYSIENKTSVKLLHSYLYNNATIFLKRKHDKFNMTYEDYKRQSAAKPLETEGSETT